MLFGRTGELRVIDSALKSARDGRGQLLLFSGEAGIGKTRLADEASELARALGFKVAWGRTWEGAGTPPNWPWTQILRELIEDQIKLAPSEQVDLAPLVPELARAEALDRVSAFRTFDALATVLKRAARATPRLLVLDDLHAADRSTVLGLHHLARGLRELPLLVIATHREAEARVRSEVNDLLEQIAREGTRLLLSRLEEADVRALLLERLGVAAADSVRAIHRSTEGNPLFVHEVASLIASGRPGSVDLPDGIRAAVAGHVGLLSPSTQRGLGAAALLGRAFSRIDLAEVLGIDQLEPVLREAAAAGVVTRTAEGAAFTHVLLAEALRGSIDPSERARLHGAIAKMWTSRPTRDAKLTEIAHHLLEAGGDPAEAIGWTRRAAAHAIQHLAFDQAAELYLRALALVPRLADGERVAIELTIGRGEALSRAGAIDDALALCRQAFRRARAIGAVDLEARAAIASATHFNFLRVNSEVTEMLERALESVGESNDALRAQLLGHLSSALHPSPVPRRTADLGKEALELARKVGDPEVMVGVFHEVSISGYGESLPATGRLSLAREMTSLARSVEHAPALVRIRLLELFARLQLGDSDGAEEQILDIERSVSRGGPRERSLMCLVRAMHARLQGRFAEADASLEEACEQSLPEDLPRNRLIHAWAQAYTRGNDEDLRAAQSLGEIRMPPQGSAWLAAALGEGGAALDQAPTGDFASPSALAVLADACVLAGVPHPSLEAELHRAKGELIMFGPVTCLGPCDRLLGGLAALRGDQREATARFESAIALSERTGAAPFLAKSLAEHGRMLAGAKDERASLNLDRAHGLATRLGMTRLARQIETLATPRPQVAPREEVGLAREGELWILSRGATEVRLRDSKGLAYLERLLENPHREIHVAELYGLGSERGDAGPIIDATARREYERRLEDLEDELREAEAFGDPERVERAQVEIDALAEELARAVGLGGRERRAGSLTERARINVQRRLKDVLTRVEKTAPALARHLESTLKTGTFCSYRPVET